MVELSKERIEQILHEETMKNEELTTILRSLYTRYMLLYEKYYADIDALNDAEIARLRAFHEETKSLLRYYYMDIPQDICTQIEAFEDEYSDKLLGHEWHKYLSDSYESFKENHNDKNKDDKELKSEFSKQALKCFYAEMDSAFREGFGTESQTTKNLLSGIAGLLFGKE